MSGSTGKPVRIGTMTPEDGRAAFEFVRKAASEATLQTVNDIPMPPDVVRAFSRFRFEYRDAPRACYRIIDREEDDCDIAEAWDKDVAESIVAALGSPDARELRAELVRTKAERDAYLENLSSVQARCTELLLELRALQRVSP